MDIVVPELGESIVEATVGRWLKHEGDRVAVGEALVELQTDKVDLEVGARQDGVLAHILHQEGEDVKVGEVLGQIEPAPAGETAPRAAGGPAAQAAAQPASPLSAPSSAPEPPAKTAETPAPAPETPILMGTGSEPASIPPAAPTPPRGDGSTGERATPLARRLAEEHQVDLSAVADVITGSGPGERITREDVQRFIDRQAAAPSQAVPPAASTPSISAAPPTVETAQPTIQPTNQLTNRQTNQPSIQPPIPSSLEQRLRMSRRRRTIAARLLEAQHSTAMLTTFNDVDMSAVMDLRTRRKESFQQRNGVKLGFMSFFVKASIGALKEFPQVNAEIQGDEIVLKHYYDIGMAIGAAEGLVVPVLRAADRMSFAEIEKTIQDFSQKVNSGTLTLEDLRGGTFTITNGGVFGSLLSTPILNPPQVAILGLHRIEPRPVALDGQVIIRPMMYMALSYDHRIVDGREAVQFLVRIKELIQDPETLLLEG